jgi:hypothetical protein
MLAVTRGESVVKVLPVSVTKRFSTKHGPQAAGVAVGLVDVRQGSV